MDYEKEAVKKILTEFFDHIYRSDTSIDYYVDKINAVYHPPCNCSKCTGMLSAEEELIALLESEGSNE